MENYKKYWHPKFKLAIDLINVLYELDEYCTGSCCYIVTNDYNLYDDYLDFVMDHCESEENKDAVDKELSSTICKILKQMNFTQRAILFEYLKSGIDIPIYNEECLDTFLSLYNKSIDDIVKEYNYRY